MKSNLFILTFLLLGCSEQPDTSDLELRRSMNKQTLLKYCLKTHSTDVKYCLMVKLNK